MSTEVRKIQFDFTARDRGVGQQMRETERDAQNMQDGLEGGSSKMGKLGGMASKLTVGLAAVGAAAATIGPMISKGLDAQAANAKFTAQLGLTTKESERIGGAAGHLYSQAYGESMDEVRGAITQVIRNMDGMRQASSADLQAVTAEAMTLATVMDEEVGRVTATVSQMLRTGMAKNAKEAFDTLTRGAQLGADKAQDLLDTFDEYSTHFRDLGLSGKQALGIIVQGLHGGAFNADKVGDALKELTIRVQDLSAAPALKQLGLDGKQMAAEFAKGGPVAARAFDLIMDKLRAVEDPTKRYALAQQILGTQSEDMAKALMSIDPSSAVKSLGEVEGATKKAGDAMGNTAKSKLTAFKRSIETNVVNVLGKAVDSGQKLASEMAKGYKLGDSKKASNDLQKLGSNIHSAANWARKELVPALKDLKHWVVDEVGPGIKKFYSNELKEAQKGFKWVRDAVKDNKEPLKDLGKFLGTVATVIMRYVIPALGKLAGHNLKMTMIAVSLLVRWMGFATKAFKSFAGTVGSVTAFVTKTFLSMVSYLVKGAAKAFGWVPGLGGKLRTAAKEVEAFKNRTNAAIDRIRAGKRVKIDVDAKGHWQAHTAHDPSRRIPGLAKGGPVPAMWSGATRAYDSQPALLRVDEHVWTPEEVSAVGGHRKMLKLRQMAKQGLLQGLAAGGPVGVSVSASTPSTASMQGSVWKPINTGVSSMLTKLANQLAKYVAMFGGATGVVRAARSMIGYPYSWGGGGRGGPSYGIGRGSGTFGFDCSGLTEYAWWQGARKSIGGTTYSQWPNSKPTARRPGALGFPHMDHVVIASDRPGYIIQAPFTGSYVQEVPSSRSYSWRWPKAAGYYAGGPVKRLGEDYVEGFAGRAGRAGARVVGIAGDPRQRMQFRGSGGPVAAYRPYVVGEHGPEIITPRQPGTVHPAGSRVVTQNIALTVQLPVGVNPVEAGRQIAEVLRVYKAKGGKMP